MTFYTPVTPTRVRLSLTGGSCAWTSTSWHWVWVLETLVMSGQG